MGAKFVIVYRHHHHHRHAVTVTRSLLTTSPLTKWPLGALRRAVRVVGDVKRGGGGERQR